MEPIEVRSARREEMVDVTEAVARSAEQLGAGDGAILVYCPHTTAAVCVNEGADPDVARDLLAALARLVPRAGEWRHAEGNSDAHVKSVLVGPSVVLPISGGKLALGTWQHVFFCEFDGPRSRRLLVARL